MASSTALLRSVAKNLFSGNLFRLRSLRVAPSATLSSCASPQMSMRFDHVDRTISGRRDFSDGSKPKKATVVTMSPTGEIEVTGEGFHFREDEYALNMKIDMPGGFSKEDVKVSVIDNDLIIRGNRGNKEETTEDEDDDDQESSGRRRYSAKISLGPNTYKYDEIKAELKNDVINVTLPKLKEEERKDIVRVQVN